MHIAFQILSSVNGWRESNRCLISSRIGTGFFSRQDVKYSCDVLPKDAKPEKGNSTSVDEAGRIILNRQAFHANRDVCHPDGYHFGAAGCDGDVLE